MTWPKLLSLLIITHTCFHPFSASGQLVFLQEGFDGPSLPATWTVTLLNGSEATWIPTGAGTNPPIAPFAGNGQMKFNSYDAPQGEQARLTTPSLDLASSIEPYIEFFMYHDEEFQASPDSVYVEISTGDSISGPWTQLKEISRPRSTNRWERERISLFPYMGNLRVYLGFRGVSRYGNNIYLDEVSVKDIAFHDIGAVAIIDRSMLAHGKTSEENRSRHGAQRDIHDSESIPHSFLIPAANTPVRLSTVVQNHGTFDEPTFDVFWMVDGVLQSPAGNISPLLRGARDTIMLPEEEFALGTYEVTSWTFLPSDSTRSNDTTHLTISVLDSSVVFFESFNGSVFPPVGWSTINRDGSILAPWFAGTSSSVFVPYEGQGFAANNFQRANGLYLDDYLITPPIGNVGVPGMTDSLIFWVRSAQNPQPFANFPDTLMVLLSTSGTDTASFSTILDYFEVPKGSWTHKAYSLSNVIANPSTIHIAFRYLHFNGGPSGTGSDFVGIDAVQVKRDVQTSVHTLEEQPRPFVLYQNYPNPFNPQTIITYALPVASEIRLRVFDVLGRTLSTLVEKRQEPGTHSLTWSAEGLPSGVYYYRLEAENFSLVRHMLLLR